MPFDKISSDNMIIKLMLFQLRGKANPKSFEDAHKDCRSSGGHLVEIKEKNYIGAYLSEIISREQNHEEQDRYWIGGLRNYIAGKKFDVWYDSADMLNFDGFPRNDPPSNNLSLDDQDISFGITITSSQNTA